jgi:hypothetical protein
MESDLYGINRLPRVRSSMANFEWDTAKMQIILPRDSISVQLEMADVASWLSLHFVPMPQLRSLSAYFPGLVWKTSMHVNTMIIVI